MNYYSVTIKRTVEMEMRIQAESRAEAELKALEYMAKGKEIGSQVAETIITSCDSLV